MATLNIGMKVNRAITGATTVNANAYAMVTYSCNADPTGGILVNEQTTYMNSSPQGQVITRYFGPAQSIPATFTTAVRYSPGGNVNSEVFTSRNKTWTLLSGVELVNTQ